MSTGWDDALGASGVGRCPGTQGGVRYGLLAPCQHIWAIILHPYCIRPCHHCALSSVIPKPVRLQSSPTWKEALSRPWSLASWVPRLTWLGDRVIPAGRDKAGVEAACQSMGHSMCGSMWSDRCEGWLQLAVWLCCVVWGRISSCTCVVALMRNCWAPCQPSCLKRSTQHVLLGDATATSSNVELDVTASWHFIICVHVGGCHLTAYGQDHRR